MKPSSRAHAKLTVGIHICTDHFYWSLIKIGPMEIGPVDIAECCLIIVCTVRKISCDYIILWHGCQQCSTFVCILFESVNIPT